MFLRDKIVFKFFRQGGLGNCWVENMFSCISWKRSSLSLSLSLSLIFRPGKNTAFSGKKYYLSSAAFFQMTIFSGHLKIISYFRVLFFLRNIIFHFLSGGMIVFSGKEKSSFPIIQGRSYSSAIFRKIIFSRRLEKQNVVFRAV